MIHVASNSLSRLKKNELGRCIKSTISITPAALSAYVWLTGVQKLDLTSFDLMILDLIFIIHLFEEWLPIQIMFKKIALF